MKKSSWLLAVFSVIFPLFMEGQDKLPARMKIERPASVPGQFKGSNVLRQKITVPNSMPVSFKNTAENEIDSICFLSDILERMAALSDGSEDTLRILHLGDSHVRGHIFPRTTGDKLKSTFGAIVYEDMGINGATCLTFTHPSRIAGISAFNPALLVLSFGTNESHGRGYQAQAHYRQIDEFVRLLRDSLPGIPIIMTTPPGSYEAVRNRRKRRTYTVNPRTEVASETIRRYAREHAIAVWDLYGIAGGSQSACSNWKQAGMMRPDHVHYLPDGYRLQGELFYEALMNAYNEYISR